MEELKDNVCEEETTRTEQGSSVEEEKGSAVLGKFKNVDALARAYEALQSEFTKRSQRLKELEKAQREADNTPTGGLKQGGEKDRGTGVEKLRAAAKAKKEREKAFDSFVAELESEGSPKIVENGNGQPDSLHTSVAEEHGFSAASSADLGVGVEESPT
ncbi:MAG: hypothetical protein IJV80_04110, partial [Clostridia bacterium]|nr:hypothetical protein [Clostridia bacterium]